MSIPAHAFGEAYPKDLPQGSVFKFRGAWSLRVAGGHDHSFQGLIFLEGDHVGRLVKIGPGMPRCIAIIEPFQWFPAGAEGAAPGHIELQTATLTVTPNGPVIIGGDIDSDRFDTEYVAFRSDGTCDADYDRYGAGMRFAEWTGELQHSSRPFESLGRLFAINRSAAG